jgi:hypothetical protein
MADVKHYTTSPINNFEGFLHIFYCRIKNVMESLTEKLFRQVGWIENAKRIRWCPIPNRDQIKLIYTSQSSMQAIQIILNMDSVE